MNGEMRNGWGAAECIRLLVLVGLVALIAAGPAPGELWSVVAAAAGEVAAQLLTRPRTGRPLPPPAGDRPAATEEDDRP
ncbi:hypothetical protein ACFWP3_41240 [Streptomyces sp. NPDC058525]|uniref:hypothetical protein n=1 Tax=unclassified Streptomyces TaxID=2593676 RepID=UPI003647D209